MKIVAAIVVTALMLGACEAWAPESMRNPQPKGTQSASAEKKICKTVNATGSNMPTRVCSTQAEWDAYGKAGQEGVEADKQARDGMGAGTQAERPR